MLNRKAKLKAQFTHRILYMQTSCGNVVGIYLLKVNNRKTRTRCEICLKLTIKTPERRQ